jgi:hypothetical protein
MADDVFRNAVPQQPAPNINNDTTKTLEEQGKNNDDNKMDEDIEINRNLAIKNSYVDPSTTTNVATTTPSTTATAKEAPNPNYQAECPETPYTSNTTSDKYNTSSSSYLIKTPTPSSDTDMVIDEPKSPTTYTIRTTPGRRSFRKKKDSSTPLLSSPVNLLSPQQQRSPSTQIKPIRPFTLGQEINISSLASAVQAVQAESNNYDGIIKQDVEQSENRSESSMDTSDVSTLLKPKSIFNPYSKQNRKNANLPTTNAQRNNSTSADQQMPVTSTNNTNTLAPDRTPLIPIDPSDSTNRKEATDVDQTQDTYINELSQEEADLISKELEKHEQQNKWVPVGPKTSSPINKKPVDTPVPTNNNPYSPLDDEDTDSDTTDATKTTTNYYTSDGNHIKTPPRQTKVQTASPKRSPNPSPTHGRGPINDRNSKQNPRRKGNTNPGRGGGAPYIRTTPTRTITQKAVTNHNPSPHNDSMEIDVPPSPSTETATPTENGNTHTPVTKSKSTTEDPNPADESVPLQEQSNNSSNKQNDKQTPRRTSTIKHQHTYRLLVKAYANEKEQENFTRIKVLKTIFLALQKVDPVTSLVVPSDDQVQKRIYNTLNPESKNRTEYEKIENLLHYTSSNSIQGTIQISSNTIYSTIKKNLDTKKILQETTQITLYRNNINAKNLTEVGFFANHLVRHDTIECTKWITSKLPSDTPDFQSDLITVWGGPPKERKGAGVLKIYAEREHVPTLSKLLQQKFNNPNQSTFTSKEYFDTLDLKVKGEYIQSQ